MVPSMFVCSHIRNEHLLGSNYWTAGFFQRGQGGAVTPPPPGVGTAAPPESRRYLLPFTVKYT